MKDLLCAVVAALVLPGCGSLIVTQKSVETLSGRTGFDWQTHETDAFDVYAEPGLAAAEDPEAFAADAAGAKERVLAHLELAAYEPTISIFVVASRGRMKDLIGRPTQAMGYYSSNAVCLVGTGSRRGTLTHEMLHVIAMNAWGLPERWINEGLAVDAPGPWRGHDPHAVCKRLQERGELPSLAELTRRFDRIPALASYPAAGSFVRHLRETYGLETVHLVWQGGRRELPAATGLDLEALERSWLAVVAASDAEGLDYPALGAFADPPAAGAPPGPAPTVVERIQNEAIALAPLLDSAPAQAFLAAAADLPPAPARTVYRDDATRVYVAAAAAAALPETDRAALTEVALEPETFYYTKYGSPLAFGRALDLVGDAGVSRLEGLRVLDFGYGSIGQLRMMAAAGGDAVGVDVDSFLAAIYADPVDQGPVERSGGSNGRVTLINGAWPGDVATRERVGAAYDLIVSKNTLKRGYIHPEREVDPRMLVHLGVDDAAFVHAVAGNLKPGGFFLIYNLSPAPSKPDEPYKPWADGRCPFDRALLASAGLAVIAYDVDDSPTARAIGRALGWDQGERGMDLENDLFATYTLVRRVPG